MKDSFVESGTGRKTVLKIKLESFEGPLDLLLHLIQKAEVDIYDIPISQITDQYIAYLDTVEDAQLEVASEFLVMAATLLEIKSRMLLPKPPPIETEWDELEMEDPRKELVERLLEYKRFKDLAETLREREVERSLIFTREPMDLSSYVTVDTQHPLTGITMVDLIHAFDRAIKKKASGQRFAKIRRDEISVKDRIKEIRDWLEERGGKGLFSQMFEFELTKEEIVITFIALLEMMKSTITCYQHQRFDDIVIQLRNWEGESIDYDE
jgi:segregation and condensation protein A